MSGRGGALALMVLGGALAVVPAFAWYVVARPAGEVRVSGFSGAGQLLLMPLLGAAAVVAGAVLLSAPADRRRATAVSAGLVALVAGVVALAFAVWAAAAPDVELRAGLPGGDVVLPATVELTGAAVAAPVLAAALALAGAAMAWTSRAR
jgi:hypothetical protein